MKNRYNNFYQIQAELNNFIFPKGVTEFYQDLKTNCVHFKKNETPCVISITQNKNNFNISSKKNGRSPRNVEDQVNITEDKLRKTLFKFASEI